MDAGVVRLRVLEKANRLDFIEPIEKCLADAVHSVHYAAVAGQNDGEFKIAIEHQAGVVHDFAAG